MGFHTIFVEVQENDAEAGRTVNTNPVKIYIYIYICIIAYGMKRDVKVA